jgi:hypothetical protein
MIPGGETAATAWFEARSSFVSGNFIATILLAQGLAEHVLAAEVSMGLSEVELPKRISFSQTLELCAERGFLPDDLLTDLRRLMALRNPLSHFRDINDPENLSRRIMDSRQSAEMHLFNDAAFAIGVTVRMLSLRPFRVDR